VTKQELEEKVKRLEDRLINVEDIQEIEKLQRIYGYYLDNRHYEEVIDLFSEKAESIEIGGMGVYLGKKGVINLMRNYYGASPPYPGKMAMHLQLQGVVHIDPSGDTAKGRWYCLMIQAQKINKKPEIKAIWGHGKYENEYIKENGKWMIKKILFINTFRTPYEDGWVKTPTISTDLFERLPDNAKPDMPSTAIHPYPENYTLPFHYKNPITGK
jgi:hypothetical protein